MNDFQAWRIRNQYLIAKWVRLLVVVAIITAFWFMVYMAATAYIEMHEDRERAVQAQAEAFEILNGRMFVVDGQKFRVATEQLPKLIGE